MKTRFDYSGVWITGVGEAVPVGNMETPHLLNTVRILVQKPARTLSILVKANCGTSPQRFSATWRRPLCSTAIPKPMKSLSLKASCIVSVKSATPAFPLKTEWR